MRSPRRAAGAGSRRRVGAGASARLRRPAVWTAGAGLGAAGGRSATGIAVARRAAAARAAVARRRRAGARRRPVGGAGRGSAARVGLGRSVARAAPPRSPSAPSCARPRRSGTAGARSRAAACAVTQIGRLVAGGRVAVVAVGALQAIQVGERRRPIASPPPPAAARPWTAQAVDCELTTPLGAERVAAAAALGLAQPGGAVGGRRAPRARRDQSLERGAGRVGLARRRAAGCPSRRRRSGRGAASAPSASASRGSAPAARIASA